MADKDVLAEELDAFEDAVEAESENRGRALESIRFNRLGEQWPEKIYRERMQEGRPALTLNHAPAFIRQVVNDARQNKPQITIKPVDGGADQETANIYKGLIKAIEIQSKADIAYDTAVDFAATMGFGYIRVAIEYEFDDSFDKGLRIQPIFNPFSVYGDPYAKGGDSADWNRAFITDLIPEDQFEAKYKGADKVDWKSLGYSEMAAPWKQDDSIQIAESWLREEVDRKILLMSDQSIIGADEYKIGMDYFQSMSIHPINERMTKSHKITQRIMSGAEILETNEWAGRYIPVVPVYGEEVNVEGKRYLFSLTHHAMDAMRMHNYWRTVATEVVALSPRVPFIGHEGAFDIEPEKWATANTDNHAYLQVKKGMDIPQRQPIDSSGAAGSMQQAMAAVDDMKAIIGLYDASLGKRSNETSGIAINSRKHEGDVSTFHIQDNLSRGIRHLGCILVDLIPKVYGERQIIRILGDDGSEMQVKQGPAPEGQPPKPPEPTQEQQMKGLNSSPLVHPNGMEHVYDLSVGKYDVVVDTGPSFTTRREETAAQMGEFLKSFPQAAPLLGDIFVKALDWPQADEIAQRLKAMVPQQAQGGLPPELQGMIQQGQQHIAEQGKQIEQLTSQVNDKAAQAKAAERKNEIEAYKAETDRIKELVPYIPPDILQQLGLQNAQQMAAQPSPETPAAPASPLQINIPDNLGQSLTDAVAPAIHEAVSSGMSKALSGFKMPPPVAMKRTPVRDQNGLIMHTIDEPVHPPSGVMQ